MWVSRVLTFLGIPTILAAGKDIKLLYLSRFLRTSAFGSSGLILAVFLTDLGHSESRVGLFMTLTLCGDVALSLVLTNWADDLGRRRTVLLGSVLMVVSGLVFTFASNYWVLLLAAIFGVISPSGNEIGPFRAVEEGMIASLAPADDMSSLFAGHIVAGTLGVSFGTFAAGRIISIFQNLAGWTEVRAFRSVFVLYSVIGLIKAVVATQMSEASEVAKRSGDRDEERQEMLQTEQTKTPTVASRLRQSFLPQLSAPTRSILRKLCLLFAVDSLASGMVAFTLLSLYLHVSFDAPMTLLSSLLAVPFILSAISSLIATPLSKRLGLLPTMAFTHLPSSIVLGLLPLAPNLAIACVLLIIRASLSTMDQGPRAVFLARVVRPEERTKVMGIVNTVKTIAQSGGPTVTGIVAHENQFWLAFVLAGALKASYDIAILVLWSTGGAGESLPQEERETAIGLTQSLVESDNELDSIDGDIDYKPGR